MKYTSLRILKKQRLALEYLKIKLDQKNLQKTLAFLITLELIKQIGKKKIEDPYEWLIENWSEADSVPENQLTLFSDKAEPEQSII